MTFLGNSFSLNMLPPNTEEAKIVVRKLAIEEAKSILGSGFKSIVGHQDLAMILSNMFHLPVEYNRETIQLFPNDVLIVAQYRGPRLPEGSTELPSGSTIEFYKVELV